MNDDIMSDPRIEVAIDHESLGSRTLWIRPTVAEARFLQRLAKKWNYGLPLSDRRRLSIRIDPDKIGNL